MEIARLRVKRDEADLAKLLVRSASPAGQRSWVGDEEYRGGRTPELEKKTAPLVIFDEARVWEHLGTTGRVLPRLIWPARHYSELSTVSSTTAAMETVAGPIYGLNHQIKGRVSISGGWRSLRCCVSSKKSAKAGCPR